MVANQFVTRPGASRQTLVLARPEFKIYTYTQTHPITPAAKYTSLGKGGVFGSAGDEIGGLNSKTVRGCSAWEVTSIAIRFYDG